MFSQRFYSFGSKKNNTFWDRFPTPMEQTQLFEYIITLQPEEKEGVLQFASLPYFNNGKLRALVTPMLNLYFQQILVPSGQAMGIKEEYNAIFPGQAFIEGKIEKVRVEALKVVRTFLTVHNYLREGNEFQQTLDFSEITYSRGLNLRYKQLLSKLQKIKDESSLKTERSLHEKFLLEYAKHNEESLHNQLKGDLGIPNVVNALELYYYQNKLALLNRFLLQRKVAKIEIPESLGEVLTENKVPARYLTESVLLKINFVIFNLLSKEKLETSDMRAFFDLLRLHEKEIDPDNLRGFYTYLRNLCVIIFKSDAQNDEINYTLFELYQDNLTRGYLHYKGRLHSATYLAVGINAIWVKQYNWALDFIEKYKIDVIDENENQDYYRLNKANYLFGTNNYSECLDLLPENPNSVPSLLLVKRLELKAHYELQSDLLSYKIDAFKMFLSRTSPKLLSETQRQIHLDFVNLLSQIINSMVGDKKRATQLIQRIKDKKQAADWRWLMAKAEAIKNGS